MVLQNLAMHCVTLCTYIYRILYPVLFIILVCARCFCLPLVIVSFQGALFSLCKFVCIVTCLFFVFLFVLNSVKHVRNHSTGCPVKQVQFGTRMHPVCHDFCFASF